MAQHLTDAIRAYIGVETAVLTAGEPVERGAVRRFAQAVQQHGGRVLRCTPRGELRGEVTVDAAQATCPGFVGPGRDILAITTAQENLDDWTDRSGAIFLADVGATGIPDTRWPGSTTTPYWSTA